MENRRLRTYSRTVLPLALAALAVSCSSATEDGAKSAREGGAPDSPSYSVPQSVPDVTSAAVPALPIEAYLASQDERKQILKASRLAAKDCMARYGFDYTWTDSGTKTAGDDNAANRQRRYGIVDEASASKYGYGLPVDGSGAPEAPGVEMSEAANRTFLGDSDPLLKVSEGEKVGGKEIPKGGCAGEAKRKIGKGLDDSAAREINMASFKFSLDDEQVKSAIAAWSKCMGDSGHTFESPLQPFDELAADGVTPNELATAKADIQCKYRTNLLGIWVAVESEIQKAMIGKKEEVLQDARKETERSVKNASEALRGNL